jgi:hypothetical protein
LGDALQGDPPFFKGTFKGTFPKGTLSKGTPLAARRHTIFSRLKNNGIKRGIPLKHGPFDRGLEGSFLPPL